MTKYYIAFPAPIILELEFINKALKIKAIECEENNQVCQFESSLTREEIETKIDGRDLILLTDKELSEWL